jgi:hypothetical protein
VNGEVVLDGPWAEGWISTPVEGSALAYQQITPNTKGYLNHPGLMQASVVGEVAFMPSKYDEQTRDGSDPHIEQKTRSTPQK